MKKEIRFKTSRWIMLSIAVLLNSFLIFYSCLDAKITSDWNKAFTNFFASIINGMTHKEVEVIPLESIKVNLSNEEKYVYNYLPGYKVDEIPLGSAKQIDCTFSPSNASNQSITYKAEPSENVTLNQTGSTLSVVGMKLGKCVITGTSSDGSYTSSVEVNVVETVAPTKYEIAIDETDIAIGTTQTIKFDIDGGCLGHDELINFRYYDTRKLSYHSSDTSKATVDENGVIYPQVVGSSTITVSNGDYSRSVNVNVVAGTVPTPYTNLKIEGSNVCYANDMILDQNGKKNNYPLSIYDGETKLASKDFIWSSSNELLVKVDNIGVMRGFRKASTEDESAIITAKSKLTGQEATFNVTVKNQLPVNMYVSFKIGEKTYTNPSEVTFAEGDNISVTLSYNPYTQTKDVIVVSSDTEIINFTNEGGTLTLHILKEGDCTIKITSVINPELSLTISCHVVKAGAITSDNIDDFGLYIRKSLGHAAVFGLAQVFTFLTLYMFLYDKKWWLYTSISLCEGLFIAGLSELIQHFVPSRDGRLLDVLIDFVGVAIGAALTFLGIYMVKLIKNKKKNKENQ